jgi:hypothetical protein
MHPIDRKDVLMEPRPSTTNRSWSHSRQEAQYNERTREQQPD